MSEGLQALAAGAVVVYTSEVSSDALAVAQSDAAPGLPRTHCEFYMCIDGWKNVAQCLSKQTMQVTLLARPGSTVENRKWSVIDLMSLAAQSNEVKNNVRVPLMTEQVQHAWLMLECMCRDEGNLRETTEMSLRGRGRQQVDLALPPTVSTGLKTLVLQSHLVKSAFGRDDSLKWAHGLALEGGQMFGTRASNSFLGPRRGERWKLAVKKQQKFMQIGRRACGLHDAERQEADAVTAIDMVQDFHNLPIAQSMLHAADVLAPGLITYGHIGRIKMKNVRSKWWLRDDCAMAMYFLCIQSFHTASCKASVSLLSGRHMFEQVDRHMSELQALSRGDASQQKTVENFFNHPQGDKMLEQIVDGIAGSALLQARPGRAVAAQPSPGAGRSGGHGNLLLEDKDPKEVVRIVFQDIASTEDAPCAVSRGKGSKRKSDAGKALGLGKKKKKAKREDGIGREGRSETKQTKEEPGVESEAAASMGNAAKAEDRDTGKVALSEGSVPAAAATVGGVGDDCGNANAVAEGKGDAVGEASDSAIRESLPSSLRLSNCGRTCSRRRGLSAWLMRVQGLLGISMRSMRRERTLLRRRRILPVLQRPGEDTALPPGSLVCLTRLVPARLTAKKCQPC